VGNEKTLGIGIYQELVLGVLMINLG